jgi:hypothetical protein
MAERWLFLAEAKHAVTLSYGAEAARRSAKRRTFLTLRPTGCRVGGTCPLQHMKGDDFSGM